MLELHKKAHSSTEGSRQDAAFRETVSPPFKMLFSHHPRQAVLAFASQVNAVHVITFFICDLQQNWRSNLLHSNTTGHTKPGDNADLIFVLFRGAFILCIRRGR